MISGIEENSSKKIYICSLSLAILLHIVLFLMLSFSRHSKSVEKDFLSTEAVPSLVQTTLIEGDRFMVPEQKEIKPVSSYSQTSPPVEPLREEPIPLKNSTIKSGTIEVSKASNSVRLIKKKSKRVKPNHESNQVSPVKQTKKKPKLIQSKQKPLEMVEKDVRKLLEESLRSRDLAEINSHAAAIAKYKHLILESISQQWIVPPKIQKHLETKLVVRLAPGGMVLNVTIVRSSGNPILDRSAQTAIYKASPLPVPSQSDLFNTFRQINLTVRPEGVLA